MLMLLGAATALAIPAKRVYRTITQPDGTTVRAMLVGDEFCHYYVGEDGTPMDFAPDGAMRYIKANADGSFVYSPMAAAEASLRTPEALEFIRSASAEVLEAGLSKRYDTTRNARIRTAPTIRKAAAQSQSAVPQYGMGLFTSNYPRTGEVRSLVLLVEYQDVKFRTPDTHRFFDDMLNKEDFSEYNATGSARDYFLEQSYGNFRPQFDVYGPVLLKNKMSYYGENSYYGEDSRPQEMVLEAVELLKDEIDFSVYDYDNDGKVDNIYVIYAGLGENSGGSANSVWPHSYQIPNGPVYNGKTLFAYACSNEITDGKPEGIGTFCHEYSHVLGLPDLYSTSYSLSCTPKTWSIMDYGSYNNDTRTPPNFGIYERNALGWAEPVVADGPETVELDAIHKNNCGYLIQTMNTNEFFLIENRQQDGWDTYIPGHGMLLWHIDFNQSIWDQNIVNNNSRHQYVDIVEASGRTGGSTLTLAGYTFPGTSGNTSITRDTNPALVDWNGTGIDMPITEIAEEEGIISFKLLGGAIDVPAPAAPELTAGVKGDVAVKWTAVDDATSYMLSFYTRDGDGNIRYVGEYECLNTGNVLEYTVEGLRSNTEYFCVVYACIGRNISEASEEASVTTPQIDFIYTAPTAISCEPNGTTAVLKWEPLDGAVRYLISAEYEELADDIETKITFGESTDTQVTIPDGWVWSEGADNGYFSVATGFFGEAAPALKFENNNAFLTSPQMELDIKKVSFWVRGAFSAAANKLDLQGRFSAQDSWRSLKLFTGLNVYNSRGTTLSADIPSNVHQLNFVFTATKGGIAFDDLTLTTSGYIYTSIVEGLDVGDALTHTIDVPQVASGVRFRVTGVDNEGRLSMPSNSIFAKFETSGIAGTATDTGINVDGSTIVYKGNAGDVVTAYTLSGAVAAKVVTDSTGYAETTLRSGLYIVATPQGSRKINIR